ncbi:MAG: anti-sigma factor RsbA family regulatory protein [Solirubrobacteraceae bacterium]
MTPPAPHPEHGPFHHRALLYADDDQYLAGALPFLHEGLEAGDAMLVAVGPAKARLLRGELGAAAGEIRFADMLELGRNPARIIPAWQELVDARDGRGVRGIGEPIWPDRAAGELAESQRHEMLLNVAFAQTPDFELLCPYDTARLPEGVIEEAQRSHPPPDRAGEWERGWSPFDGPLARVGPGAHELWFGHDELGAARALVAREAARAGLDDHRTGDLMVAVGELTANSVRHGGGTGLLRIWAEPDAIFCQVDDAGRISDPLAGRRRPDVTQPGGFGLWIVHQLCDLVQVRSAPFGGVVRVTMRLG